jgi:hypothetical protein
LVAWPSQVREVEQRVQTYKQECYISLRKLAQQHVQETIEAGIATSSCTEISLKVPQNRIV